MEIDLSGTNRPPSLQNQEGFRKDRCHEKIASVAKNAPSQ